MRRFLSLSIRNQLLLIVLIVALPSAILILSTGLDQRARTFKETEQNIRQLAEIIASEQKYRAAAAEQLLKIIGELPDVKERKRSRVQPLLIDLHTQHTQYSNIFITDIEGNVWASALPSQGVNVADRRYFRNAIATNRFSSGDYLVSRFTNKLVISFAHPYTDRSGSVAGVIVLGFDLDHYRRLLSTEELRVGKSYLLLDYRGVVLARPVNPEEFVGKQYNAEQFKRMEQGPDEDLIVEMGMDGRERLIAYRKLRLDSEQIPYMYIRAAIPTHEVLSQANRHLLMNAMTFSVFLLLALMLAWFIGKRSIADRIALLERASNEMAHGDLAVRVSERIQGGELGSLGRTFDHMAQQLLSRDEERTKLILELQSALADIKILQGILPICSSCKKIRNEEGVWTQLEGYISKHTNAQFSHGMCTECAKKLYPEYHDKKP